MTRESIMNLKKRHSRRTFFSQAAGVAFGSAVLPLLGDERMPPVANIADRLRQQMSDAPLAMRLKDMTADECRVFQSEFGTKLKELLGEFQPPRTWKTTLVGSVSQKGYRRDELLLQSEGSPPLPLYLLVPDV